MTSNSSATSLPEAQASPRFTFWTEFPGIAVLLMNAFWLARWYQIAVKSTTPAGWVILLLAAIMLTSTCLARFFSTLQNKPLLQRILYLAWVLTSLLTSLNLIFFTEGFFAPGLLIQKTFSTFFTPQRSVTEFWHVFIFLLAILRSILLARNPVTRDQVSKAFRTGVVMLLLSGFTLDGQIPRTILPVFYGLLFTGLLGLSVAHFVDLAESSGGRLPINGSQWVLGIFIASLGFVLLSIIAGWLIDETVAGLLAQAALVFFMLLSVLVMLIFSPILAVMLEVSNRIGQALFANSPELLAEVTSQQSLNDLRNTGEENIYLLTDLFENSKGTIMLIILGIIAIIAVILVRWKPWQRRLREEEGTSSSASRTPRPARSADEKNLPSLYANLRSRLAAARIRDVYRRLMILCERLKQPRPAALTPLEFLPRMNELFPGCDSELACITTAYLKVRYGERPESSEEVAAVMNAWGKIRKTGNLLKKKQT
ncbi:MAG: DUF4129 domain-containing protein [Anaerolineaceae bacterium]|jgi:hypothetical protein|nr:DUF4129 domain-containing protein [Anaerolineaceae bacterium]